MNQGMLDRPRVLITGHRRWPDPDAIREVLEDLLARYGALTVVHGASGNVDLTAHVWAVRARNRGLPVESEPVHAEWEAHGRAAGNLRNQVMVDRGASECHGFTGPCQQLNCRRAQSHDSHGTTDCIRRARAAGIPVSVHEWPIVDEPAEV